MTDYKVKALLERMANECSVDMVLWDQFSNAVLALQAERDKLSAEVERLSDENDKLRGMPDDDRKSCIALMEMLAEARADRDTYRKTMEAMVEAPDAIAKLLADYDALRAKLTALVEALNGVLHWATTRCPCGPPDYPVDEPKICPLCQTNVDDPASGGCRAVEETFPRNLLGKVRQALAHHSAPVGEPEDGQDRKFAFRNGQFVNRVSGEPIPKDEPIIIFRARDRHAMSVLAHYLDLAQDPHHQQAIRDRIAEFQAYREANPERLKEPGITRDITLAAPPSTPTSAPVEDVAGILRKLVVTVINIDSEPARDIAALNRKTAARGQAIAEARAALSPSLIQPQTGDLMLCTTTCFECGHELHAPFCPACNPEMIQPRGEEWS